MATTTPTQISRAKARSLTQDIKTALQDLEGNIKFFHSVQGWLPLGYTSFLEWWDSELGPIEMSNGLRNWVIYTLAAEAPKTSSGHTKRGALQEVADAIGVKESTFSNVLYKTRVRAKNRMSGRTDEDIMPISLTVPKLWWRHIMAIAQENDVPMTDLLRPIVKWGIREDYGVDLDEAITPTRKRSS